MLRTFNPLRRDPLFRAFDDLFAEADTLLRAPTSTATATARVNGYRTEEAYVLVLEVPGLTAEALEIKIEDGALHLAGKATISPPEGARVVHRELADELTLSRRFTFADDADLANTSAELKDGLLTLRVPRTVPTVRRITVKTA